MMNRCLTVALMTTLFLTAAGARPATASNIVFNGGFETGNFSDWRGMTSSFDALAAEQFRSFALGDGDTPERVLGGRVSADFFSVFGIIPLRGRVFDTNEDAPGNDGVVILAEDLWRRRYGADPAIIGHAIQIDGIPVTVVGVMPASFYP